MIIYLWVSFGGTVTGYNTALMCEDGKRNVCISEEAEYIFVCGKDASGICVPKHNDYFVCGEETQGLCVPKDNDYFVCNEGSEGFCVAGNLGHIVCENGEQAVCVTEYY